MNQLRSLNIAWLSGTALIFLFILAQTLGNHYVSSTLYAWLWFGAVFVPLSFYLIQNRRAGVNLRGDHTIYGFILVLTILYIIAVLAILMIQPLVDSSNPIGPLLKSLPGLLIFQGVIFYLIRKYIEFEKSSPSGSAQEFFKGFSFRNKPENLNLEESSIFISYSENDKEWMERIRTHLAPIARKSKLDVWAHDDIMAGEETKAALEKALKEATIAIILISADFFASDVLYDQLTKLLQQAKEQESTYIIPVLASAVFVDENEAIFRYESLNPKDQPLQSISEPQQEVYMAELARIVQTLLKIDG